MIGQYMKLAVGTLRTRLQGKGEPEAVRRAPARRKAKRRAPVRANAVTEAEAATIRQQYRGGVLIKDITASTGRSHNAIYKVCRDLPKRIDKGLGPRVWALHKAGRSCSDISALTGVDRRGVWAMIDRRNKRGG